MQISRFTKIVIFVTSLGFSFLSCIALLDFLLLLGFIVTFALFVRLRWGFRSCGSDHGLCPLDSHKPLKRLERNFYMDTLLLLCDTCGAGAFFGFGTYLGASPQKNKNSTARNFTVPHDAAVPFTLFIS